MELSPHHWTTNDKRPRLASKGGSRSITEGWSRDYCANTLSLGNLSNSISHIDIAFSFLSPSPASWSPVSATVSPPPPEGKATVRTFVVFNSIIPTNSSYLSKNGSRMGKSFLEKVAPPPTCRLAILRSSLDEAGLSLHASDPDPAMTPSSFVGQQHEFSHIVSTREENSSQHLCTSGVRLLAKVFNSLWSRPSLSRSSAMHLRVMEVQPSFCAYWEGHPFETCPILSANVEWSAFSSTGIVSSFDTLPSRLKRPGA